MRLLLLEDDDILGEGLRDFLRAEGHVVDWCRSLGDARALRGEPFDALLVDWQLPDGSGLEWLRARRARGDFTPALMLTARDRVGDRIQGLDGGADDYLVKPFEFDELLARIRALLRRARPESVETLQFGDLRLDTGTHQGFRADRPFELTAKEYDLLELFLRHPRQVLTRQVIFDRVWGYDFGGESNIIEVYIRYLRQKTEQGGEPRLIHTVRGVGYVLRDPA